MRPFHVLTAEISHETNTFCAIATTKQSFFERAWLLGDAAIVERGSVNTPLAGFLDVGRLHQWRITHVLSADAQPGFRLPLKRQALIHLSDPI